MQRYNSRDSKMDFRNFNAQKVWRLNHGNRRTIQDITVDSKGNTGTREVNQPEPNINNNKKNKEICVQCNN